MEHARADEVHAEGEPLVFELACPRCGATVALGGRVVLTPDRDEAAVMCLHCGAEAYLAVIPPTE